MKRHKQSPSPCRCSAAQHVPLDEYQANLEAIVRAVRASGIEHVLLITPTPYDRAGRAAYLQRERGVDPSQRDRDGETTATYADAARHVGERLGVPVLDAWSLVAAQAGWERELLCDGLHDTPQGQALIASAVLDAIQQAWPHLAPEAVAQDGPDFATVDPARWKDWLDGQL